MFKSSGNNNSGGDLPNPWGIWRKAAWFGIAFFCCAEASIFLSVPHHPYLTFWLPAGLYVAVLLLNETRIWPWLILAALPANLAFDWLHGTPWLDIFLFYGTNTAQAVTGAWLVRRFVAERPVLSSHLELLGLLGFSGLFSTLLGATMGATVLAVTHLTASFEQDWVGWWGANLVGILMLAPFILTWFSGPDAYHQRIYNLRKKGWEALLLILLSFVATGCLLYLDHGIVSPNNALLWLPILWAALRFGPRGATAICLLVLLPVAFFTTQFLIGLPPDQIASGKYVWIMQLFFSVAILAGVVLSVMLRERDHKIDELRQSEERFRQLTEAAFEGICISKNGRILDLNNQALKIFGCAREEIIGKEILEWVAPESRAQVAEAIRTRQESLYEHRLLRKDGSSFVAESQARVLGVGDRQVRMTAVRDITERKRTEQDLRRERDRAQGYLDTVEAIIVALDSEGRIELINQKGCRLLGYQESELLGQSWFTTCLPQQEARDNDIPHFQKLMNGEIQGNEYLENCVLTRSGELRRIAWHKSLVQDEQGRIVGSLCAGEDITARKLAEESTTRLATAVDQSAEAIVITDATGSIVYVNPAFSKITGYTREDVMGQTPRLLKSGKHAAEFYQQLWSNLTAGQVWRGHLINRRKNGQFYESDATISPVRNAAGQIVNYVSVAKDVTREVALEDQLRQSQKMEAFGQLAGGVAHDFNNIMAIIQMQASLLKIGGTLSAEQTRIADEIIVTVKRAAALTSQLLLFSRKKPIQPQDLDLNVSLGNMTKMLQRALGETIQMQIHFSAEPMFINVDPGMIDQVLLNLSVNARDAMPQGGRLVIATTPVEFDKLITAQSALARPGSFVCLSVADTGCGIPKENLAKIFEPFYTTKDVGKGTGLGLATVFGIVQQHQGWINVYSEVGQGTTFKIYFPRLSAVNDQKTTSRTGATAPRGTETILLVEDEPPMRDIVQIYLTKLGYQVIAAPTGVKAMEVWKEHRQKIRLLLTDMVMPDGMTGNELAERLLRDNPQLKVIYTSGYSPEIAGKDLPIQEGVNFIAKPFESYLLAQTIRNRLDQS